MFRENFFRTCDRRSIYKALAVRASMHAYKLVPSYPNRMITDYQNTFPAVVKPFKHMVKYFPCTTRHTRFVRVEVLIKIVENYVYNSGYKQEYELQLCRDYGKT